MKRYQKVIRHLATALVCCCLACSSDKAEELSGDYFLRMEGRSLNDILCHGDGKDIPANVVAFGYDNDFIVALQEPRDFDEAIYGHITYPEGRDQQYYWLIAHQHRLGLGPMNKEEFQRARAKYQVPASLTLEPLDWE